MYREAPDSTEQKAAERSDYYTAGFLYHAGARKVLLHHRDADAPTHPSKWNFFGGVEEEGDGSDPVATWLREMREELGISLPPVRVNAFSNYLNSQGRRRYVFYCEWPTLDGDFVLGEGQGYAWFGLEEAIALSELTDRARQDLLLFRETILSVGTTKEVADGSR